MLTLISTIGGYIVALFPRLFDMLQDRADKKHELDILHMQMRQQMSLTEKGYSPADKTEEVRENDEQDHQQYMAQTAAIYSNQEKMLESSSQWVKDMTAATRPFVTFIFVLELVLINLLTICSSTATRTEFHSLTLAAELSANRLGYTYFLGKPFVVGYRVHEFLLFLTYRWHISLPAFELLQFRIYE